MSNLSQIRIVRYEIKPEIAEKWGMSEEERHKIGVIAQELEQVLPDAVKENSEYKTVDDVSFVFEKRAKIFDALHVLKQRELVFRLEQSRSFFKIEHKFKWYNLFLQKPSVFVFFSHSHTTHCIARRDRKRMNHF